MTIILDQTCYMIVLKEKLPSKGYLHYPKTLPPRKQGIEISYFRQMELKKKTDKKKKNNCRLLWLKTSTDKKFYYDLIK